MGLLKTLFGKTPVDDAAQGMLDRAKARHRAASLNLHETLAELLEESDALRMRPVYLAGRSPHK